MLLPHFLIWEKVGAQFSFSSNLKEDSKTSFFFWVVNQRNKELMLMQRPNVSNKFKFYFHMYILFSLYSEKSFWQIFVI